MPIRLNYSGECPHDGHFCRKWIVNSYHRAQCKRSATGEKGDSSPISNSHGATAGSDSVFGVKGLHR